MTNIETIEKRREALTKIEKNRVIAQTKRGELLKQYTEYQTALAELGVQTPVTKETTKAFIAQLEKEMQALLSKLDELMPEDILEKFAEIDIDKIEVDEAFASLGLNLYQDF